MSAQFDDLLSQKIQQSFEQVEVAYSPAHWAKLQAQLPAAGLGNSGLPLSYLIRVAAVVLIGFSLIYATTEFFTSPEKIASNDIGIAEAENIKPHAETEVPEPETEEGFVTAKQREIDKSSAKKNINPQSPKTGIDKAVPNIQNPPEPKWLGTRNTIDTKEVALASLNPNKRSATFSIDRKSLKFIDSPMVIREVVTNEASAAGFNIFASSLVNYGSTQEEATFGIGAGFASSYPLLKGVRISSGLGLNQQSVGLDPDLSQALVTEGIVEQNISIDLFTVDIPLNLQFDLPSRSNRRAYISAGFSSFLYLKEDFVISSTEVSEEVIIDVNGNPETITVTQFSTQTSSGNALSRLDFARVLNISLGYQYPLGRKLNLIVEPYIKYPLGAFTSQSVQFGSGGVHLRLGFK